VTEAIVTEAATEIQLRLPARAENVALVRQALSGIGDTFAVAPALLADIKTAVTEACNNVVLHAYPDAEGLLEVDASPDDQKVAIIVRDHGEGMQPRVDDSDEPSLGLGLPLIATLSDRFEIHGGVGRGIEVRMLFRVNDQADPDDIAPITASKAPQPSPHETARAAGVAITPGPTMAPVLGRLMAMLASRADFPLDRLSEAVLITDAISAHVDAYIPGRHALVGFQDGKGVLDLWVGPLVKGGADELLDTTETPGLPASLRDLADEVKVERVSDQAEAKSGAGEYIQFRLSGAGR
jgi:anti-sigma regulatory factor (Ser/Thr protein kinase)